jgi:poly(hydroxyalkanoate) granule-associated protein
MAEAAPKHPRPAIRATTKRRQPAAGRRTRAALAGSKMSPDEGAANGNKWIELVISVVQAPVGLAATQADRLVSELVRTGSLGQREAERLLGELKAASDRAQGRAQQESARLDRFIEGRIEDVLNRVNIPSRSDIERLNASVEVLTAKVEALVSRGARSGGSR